MVKISKFLSLEASLEALNVLWMWLILFGRKKCLFQRLLSRWVEVRVVSAVVQQTSFLFTFVFMKCVLEAQQRINYIVLKVGPWFEKVNLSNKTACSIQSKTLTFHRTLFPHSWKRVMSPALLSTRAPALVDKSAGLTPLFHSWGKRAW